MLRDQGPQAGAGRAGAQKSVFPAFPLWPPWRPDLACPPDPRPWPSQPLPGPTPDLAGTSPKLPLTLGSSNVMKLNSFLEVNCCLGLGLNPKRNRFGWLCRLGRRGGWEKSVRWPSAIGPKLLFAPHEASSLFRNLTFTASTPYHSKPQTLNPKP